MRYSRRQSAWICVLRYVLVALQQIKPTMTSFKVHAAVHQCRACIRGHGNRGLFRCGLHGVRAGHQAHTQPRHRNQPPLAFQQRNTAPLVCRSHRCGRGHYRIHRLAGPHGRLLSQRVDLEHLLFQLERVDNWYESAFPLFYNFQKKETSTLQVSLVCCLQS